ncbi:hypothetical protein ACPCHT_32215 [Nucisporomicrobium flavum]|uniref:hypothetical protein n=1 Tax=Nucisporomicrobium flavum TaxID=2785915 RepID=UPI003C2B8677
MTDWSVRLVVADTESPTDDQMEALLTNLTAFSAALGHEHGNLDVQLTVTAGNLLKAITEAAHAVRKAVAVVGLTGGDIVEAEAMTWDEFDRRLDAPQVPELWSVAEAAKHLGVSNQRINQLVHSYPEALPAVVKLSGDRGPRLWLADTWRRFAKTDRHAGRRSSTSKIAKDATISA